MTFQQYLDKKNVKLRDWQLEAANALLAVMADHQERASGKSFLMHFLEDFVDGNEDFDIDNGRTRPMAKKTAMKKKLKVKLDGVKKRANTNNECH